MPSGSPQGKRERIDTTPGKEGGSRYVRRVKPTTKAPKGMKDRRD